MENQMIALMFQGASTADDMLSLFQELQEKGVLTLEDAVIAYRRGGSADVEIKQTQSVTGKYAVGGTGVGLLVGLLLGGPVGGLVGGAAIGAITGALKDFGIDDDFIRGVTEALVPDSSMLFLMGQVHDRETFQAEIKPFKAIVVSTTLSEEDENRLRNLLLYEG